MADEKNRKDEKRERGRTEEQEGEAPEATKKKGFFSLKNISMIMILLLFVAESGFLMWRYGEELIGGTKAEAAGGTDEPESQDAESADQQDGDEAKPGGVEGVLSIDPFTVNLGDPDEIHYMRLTVKLGLDSGKIAEKLVEDEITTARIRDAILAIISSTTSQEALTQEGKNQMRQKILQQVNEVLTDGEVVAVFFQDMVIQ